jgi:hypothetical protein
VGVKKFGLQGWAKTLLHLLHLLSGLVREGGACQNSAMSSDQSSFSSGTPTLRPSPHRAPAIQLPADPALSAALVLRHVQTGSTSFDRSAAIEAMAARVSRLADLDNDPETVSAELAGHAALLDALFQRWICEAMATTLPDHRAKFMKLALHCQAAYTRTLIAIAGLKRQAAGTATVSVNDDSDSDDDD